MKWISSILSRPVVIIGVLVIAAAFVWFGLRARTRGSAITSSVPAESPVNDSIPKPQPLETYEAYIPNDSLSVAGLKLGMTAQQVIAVLGEPREQAKSGWRSQAFQAAELGRPEGTIVFRQQWDYPGISVTLTNSAPENQPVPSDAGCLTEIHVTAANSRTSDGLGVSDELEKVKAAHPTKTDFDDDSPRCSKVATALFTASGGVVKEMKFSLMSRTYIVYVENRDYQIAGCCLDDTDEKVASVLGQPLGKEFSEESDTIGIHYGADDKSMHYYEAWSYPNAKLIFVSGGLSTEPRPSDPGRLDSIVISGSGLATLSGVRVGDSFEKVKWAYREREGVTPDDEGYVIGAVALSFVIRDGVVTSIEAYVSTD